jgi:hypothetical protein
LSRAISQLLWSHKGREEWFSLRENHERRRGFGLHQLRNRYSNWNQDFVTYTALTQARPRIYDFLIARQTGQCGLTRCTRMIR